VSAETQSGQWVQASDTVDTVKINKNTPPCSNEGSPKKQDPSNGGGNNMENQCVKCVNTPESHSQQAFEPDTLVNTVSVSGNQKTHNFKAGDRVRYSGTYGMVEATIKAIKTVSDKGNPLPCPLAVLDNETAIPLQQLTAIA